MTVPADLPWAKKYPPSVDWSAPLPVGPLYSLLDDAVRDYPDHDFLDFMGKITDQFFVRLSLIENALFTVELHFLHVLAQLDQDGIIRVIQYGNDHIHLQWHPPYPFQYQIFAHLIKAVPACLIENHGQLVAIQKQLCQTLVMQNLEGILHQSFCGRVGISDTAFRIENKYCGSQQVQTAERSSEDVHVNPDQNEAKSLRPVSLTPKKQRAATRP